MKTPKPVLAILGGAGHQAASRLHQAVLDRFAPRAKLDEQYPDLLVVNRAIAGVGLGGVEDAALADACLGKRLAQMRDAGATHYLLACASLHTLPQSRGCLDWMSPGARQLASSGAERVGVIASASARASGLLDRLLDRHGLLAVHHPDQGLVDRIIAQCLPGEASPATQADFLDLHAHLRSRCDRVWRACTELSAIPSGLSPEPDLCSLDLMVDTAMIALGVNP